MAEQGKRLINGPHTSFLKIMLAHGAISHIVEFLTRMNHFPEKNKN